MSEAELEKALRIMTDLAAAEGERDRLRAAVGRVDSQLVSRRSGGRIVTACQPCEAEWGDGEPEWHEPDCWWAGLQGAQGRAPDGANG